MFSAKVSSQTARRSAAFGTGVALLGVTCFAVVRLSGQQLLVSVRATPGGQVNTLRWNDVSRFWAAVSGDRSRQVVTCAAAAAQVLLPTLYGPRFDREDGPPDVIQPAAYTFTVWFPIFASAMGYAGYQARGSVRSSELLRAMGWPLAGAFTATGVWAPLVRSGRNWSAQAALAAIAVLAEVGRRRVARAETDGRLRTAEVVAVAPVVGMLAAWGQAACGVNLAALLVADGLVPAGRKASATGIALLALLGALGTSSVAKTEGTSVAARSYAGTLLWAFAGVVVGQRRRAPAVAVTAVGAALPILVVLVQRARRARRER